MIRSSGRGWCWALTAGALFWGTGSCGTVFWGSAECIAAEPTPRAIEAAKAGAPKAGPIAAKPVATAPKEAAGKEEESPARAADIAAIKAAAKAYVEAFNAGDIAKAAEFWTPAGDYTDVSGHKHAASEMFKPRHPGLLSEDVARPNVTVRGESLRFVSDGVAIEDGTWYLTDSSGGHPGAGLFTAVWVKRDGKWLLDGLRKAPPQPVSPAVHLRRLQWLVGHWEGASGKAKVLMHCGWAEDKNFLVRELKTETPDGQTLLAGVQRIGWDPLTGKFKSWFFEADGSWGEGYWSNDRGDWTVRSSIVHPDGQRGAATVVYHPIDADRFNLESTHGESAGHALPDLTIEMRRSKPAADAKK